MCKENIVSENCIDKKNKTIKVLALQLYGSRHCIPDFSPEICNKNYTAASPDGCVNCWIAWAERQINGARSEKL